MNQREKEEFWKKNPRLAPINKLAGYVLDDHVGVYRGPPFALVEEWREEGEELFPGWREYSSQEDKVVQHVKEMVKRYNES